MPRHRPKFTFTAPLVAAGLVLAAPVAALAQDPAMAELGKEVFTSEAEPPCAVCHTLDEAEATGTIGPNLDNLEPSEERVRAAVIGGVGVMPAYGETLSDEQIAAVVHYVVTAVGGAE